MANPAHALLSASGSHRWLSCTPSARLEAVLPEPKRAPGAFDYSSEGTSAHELAEAKLRFKFDMITKDEYDETYAKIKELKYFNTDFEQFVDDYVLYVASQIGDGDRPMFEQRIDYSEWVPEGFGTADVVILSKDKVRVIDLKFGQGIFVDAKDNPQLRLYALGAWSKFKDEFPEIRTIEYTIHQPRLRSITTDGTTLDKLLEWAKYFVKQKAKLAWVGQGEFVPGDHCGFCRAKAQCKSRASFITELAKLDFREPALLTDDELALSLKASTKLSTYINDVNAYLVNKAVETGKPPKGFKLSSTTSQRKITDDKKAIEILNQYGYAHGDYMEPERLKSVAQLEKLGKDKISGILSEVIVKPEGQPKLVEDNSTAEDYFGN